MSDTSFFHRLLVKLGVKKATDYNSAESLRKRGVRVGENVNLVNTYIDFCHGFLISIGNDVTLTGVTVLAHDASTQIPLGVSKVGCVEIGDRVYVGHGSIILPGVKIGSRVVIGAGTVVSKDIPDNSVAVGNPVRVVGTYDDFVEKHRRQMQEGHVYSNLWSEKTWEEKEQMRKDLASEVGYDP